MRNSIILAGWIAFGVLVALLCVDGRTGYAEPLGNGIKGKNSDVRLAQEKRREPVFLVPLPPDHRHRAPDLQPVEPQSTPRQDPTGSLTIERLKNGEYRCEIFEYRPVKLTNGSYEKRDDSDEEGPMFVWWGDKVAFGDLNGDGIEDAALILLTSTGGSGTFRELVVLVHERGVPRQASVKMLGDRTDVKNLSIRSGRIEVERMKHGPNDPMCCPTLRVKETYRLQGASLVLSR